MTDVTLRLWDFALTAYRQPEIEQLCLGLQNHWGANVNLLLWARWLELRNIELDDLRIWQAKAQVRDWDEGVVKPLRTLRQRIKSQFTQDTQRLEGARQAVKVAELEAEKVELVWLEELANDWSNFGVAVKGGRNLACYMDSLHIPDPDIRASIQTFIALETPTL